MEKIRKCGSEKLKGKISIKGNLLFPPLYIQFKLIISISLSIKGITS